MADNEYIEIRVNVCPNYVIDSDYDEVVTGPERSEWEEMTPEERETYLNQLAEEILNEKVDYYAEVVEG